MADLVTSASKDGVTTLTLADPPVNALGGAMRQALWDAFKTLPADDRAVILIGDGACFCGGVDLRELTPEEDGPSFGDLMDCIEGCDRPVVAAMHSRATGGGMELALASHYRLTAQGTRLGQPEVTLGFPPGGGATQRLPRLIGVENALDLMLSGALISDSKAISLGLVDARAKGDLQDFAQAYATALIANAPAPRRTRDMRDHLRDGAANQQIINAYRKRIAPSPMTAPKRIIDCVEAALLLPFEAGLAFELAAFEECVAAPQSQALRHMALADRKALQMPEAKGLSPKPITRVAVLGQGKRALDLSVMLLQAGLEVTLAGPSDLALPDHVQTWFDRAVAADRLSADQSDRALDRLRGPVPPEALGDVDLVIDAATGDAPNNAAISRSGDTMLAIARDDADLSGIASPETTLALGFGVPPVQSDLLVLAKGPETTLETLLSLAHLAQRLNKQTVIATDARVDLVARMLATWRMAADTCLRDGATPYQVDAALRALGCLRGPYQLLDLVGLNSTAARLPPRKAAKQPLADLIGALRKGDRLGRRAGSGIYAYDAAHPNGREDPEIVTLCAQLRSAQNLPERTISDGAIQRRCLIALANEAAYLRADGAVRQITDLDVVMHHGLGFPRWRGGPVQMADQMSLLALRRDLQRLTDHDPFIWEPAPMLDELIKNGTPLSQA